MTVTHIPCDSATNYSERLALDRLKNNLNSLAGDDEWILLSNLRFSSRNDQQSDEIDIVVIGPFGLKIVEVKHWTYTWTKSHKQAVEHEAEKVTDKAKRIGTTLRNSVPNLGKVDGAILITTSPPKSKGLQGQRIRNIPVYTLKQWKETIGFNLPSKLSRKEIQKLAKKLEPAARIAIDGNIRSLCGCSNLELKSPIQDRFHRAYRGIKSETGEQIFLHLYDLSAMNENADIRAEREYKVLYELYKLPWTPRIRDSFQPVPAYPGEMYFYTVSDDGATTLEKQHSDDRWTTDARIRFAVSSIRALRDLHAASEGPDPMLHRNITPETILVQDDNSPLFTGFEFTRIPEDETVASAPAHMGKWSATVAPEIKQAGLHAADHRSDWFSLFESLKVIFVNRDDDASPDVLEILDQGTSDLPDNRWSLNDIEEYLVELFNEPALSSTPRPVEEWSPGLVVKFRGKDYKVLEQLGKGGFGTAFKVVEVDPTSKDVFGPFVGKTAKTPNLAASVLRSHKLVRPYLGSHPGLSTVFEVAEAWHANEFVTLMKWVEGFPLHQLVSTSPISFDSNPLGAGESAVLNCIVSICEALEVFHSNGLIHGDISPGNIIISGDAPVLTDYDLVVKCGETTISEGTPRYCSPSRQLGKSAKPADDIFALAATFFHLIFGQEPFTGTSVAAKKDGLNWPDPSPAISPSLSNFLRKATDPIEANRFRDATEAKAALSAEADTTVASVKTEPEPQAPEANNLTDGSANGIDYAKARRSLVEWLRGQLIGPLPYHDHTLKGISPVKRFPTGVLYPVEVGDADLRPASHLSDELATRVQLEVEHTDTARTHGERHKSQLVQPPQQPRYVPPSSVGFSCFVTGNARLELTASAAAYKASSDRDERTGEFRTREYTRYCIPNVSLTWEDGTLTGGSHESPCEVTVRQRLLRQGSILTIALSNRQLISSRHSEVDRATDLAEKCLFEVHLECSILSGQLREYPRVDLNLLPDEDREIEIQYRDRSIYAIGHGVSVNWDRNDANVPRIQTDFLPTIEVPQTTVSLPKTGRSALDIKKLANDPIDTLVPDLEDFIEGYSDWIASHDLDNVSNIVRPDISRIKQRMIDAQNRMNSGVQLIAEDASVAEAFQITNQIMFAQISRVAQTQKEPSRYYWRPFQLAFLLTVIKSMVVGDDSFRDTVDLIWFPTGGGKTEAYLALVAFLIAWRRITYGEAGSGTTAVMRYTMRLLTSQQFDRAARMIFAMELIRRNRPELLGTTPITVGMWVGKASSPNKFKDAINCVDLIAQGASTPGGLILANCPWCGLEFTSTNYRATDDSFGFYCSNANCEFGVGQLPLPCNVVDEALYADPPSLLIGTIDKFARLAWDGRAVSFFGKPLKRPPELIIQDELHLLSGPLGSVAGLYEAGIDSLLKSLGVRPKYVASSATIHRAEFQVKRLYGRPVRVFPPPGLSCDDCYFARTDRTRPGRLYIGYLPPILDKSRGLIPIAAALLSAPESIFSDEVDREELTEAWWTQIVYHTSLSAVGSNHTSYGVDVQERLRSITEEYHADRHEGSTEGFPDSDKNERATSMRTERLCIDQLTSAKSARENAETFANLAKRYDQDGALDVVLATNMVSVGLDVGRLALMILDGQPVTTAEYIQASSRVGRADVPGIVVANYHRNQASSLFHYETFRPYHESFYRFVEAASITPFTYQVRSRALHAALVIAVRHACPNLHDNQSAICFDPNQSEIRRIIETLKARCDKADDTGNTDLTSIHIDRLVNEWHEEVQRCNNRRRSLKYDSRRDKATDSLLRGFGTSESGLWATLHSMRNVEKTALIKETRKLQ